MLMKNTNFAMTVKIKRRSPSWYLAMTAKFLQNEMRQITFYNANEAQRIICVNIFSYIWKYPIISTGSDETPSARDFTGYVCCFKINSGWYN